MSNWDDLPSDFDIPATTTQYRLYVCSICAQYLGIFRVPVKAGPAWPKILGVIGVVTLVVCAFVLPATIVTVTAKGMFFYRKQNVANSFYTWSIERKILQS